MNQGSRSLSWSDDVGEAGDRTAEQDRRPRFGPRPAGARRRAGRSTSVGGRLVLWAPLGDRGDDGGVTVCADERCGCTEPIPSVAARAAWRSATRRRGSSALREIGDREERSVEAGPEGVGQEVVRPPRGPLGGLGAGVGEADAQRRRAGQASVTSSDEAGRPRTEPGAADVVRPSSGDGRARPVGCDARAGGGGCGRAARRCGGRPRRGAQEAG